MFRCLRVFSAGTLASFHIPKTSQTRQSNTWNCPECEWMAVLSRVLCDWLATSQKSEMTDSCSNGALMRANAIKMQIWCFVTSVVYLLFHQSFASEFNLQIVSKNLKVTPHWSAKLLCKGNFIYFTHWMNWTNSANPVEVFPFQSNCISFCFPAELLFLLWGVYLCYAVRTIHSAFHEPRYMAVAIYNELLLSAVFHIIRWVRKTGRIRSKKRIGLVWRHSASNSLVLACVHVSTL